MQDNIDYKTLQDVKKPSKLREWSGDVLYLKLLVYIDSIGVSTWGKFGTIYYNQPSKGLSASQIGQIEGLMPIITALSAPVWALLADRINNKKIVYVITTIMYSLLLLLLSNDAWTDTTTDGQSKYPFILLVSIIVSCFANNSILDAYIIDNCENEGDTLYGKIKLFASIGTGVGAVFIGFMTNLYGFDVCFLIYTACTITSILHVVFSLPPRTKSEAERHIQKAIPDPQVLKKFFCKTRTIAYIIEVFIVGMAMGIVERLLFIYVQNDLGGSTFLCGVTILVTVIPEIPIFYYSGLILSTLGESGALIVSYICYIIRVIGYTVLTPDTVWYIMFLELMNGPCYAILWASVIEFTRKSSPPEWLTTTQSIVSLTYFSAGAGCGAIVGGWVMSTYGSIALFRGAAVVVSVLLLRRLIMIYVEKYQVLPLMTIAPSSKYSDLTDKIHAQSLHQP